MKFKIKKKQLIIFSFIILVLLLAIILMKINSVNVGKIKKGKAEYIDRIANVTKYDDKVIIEFNNNKDLIDNCFITTELYEKFKNNDARYNLKIGDYFKLNDISAKENYNINKALQMNYIDEDTNYMDYFAMTCGFKNKKELMKYTKAVIKLASKEK